MSQLMDATSTKGSRSCIPVFRRMKRSSPLRNRTSVGASKATIVAMLLAQRCARRWACCLRGLVVSASANPQDRATDFDGRIYATNLAGRHLELGSKAVHQNCSNILITSQPATASARISVVDVANAIDEPFFAVRKYAVRAQDWNSLT